MWDATAEGIRRDLSRYRAGFPDRHEVARRPGAVRLHPQTWSDLVRGLPWREVHTHGVLGLRMPTLFGVRVVEDPTLPPGTWRLEPGD